MIAENKYTALPASYRLLILGFVLCKIILHFAANANYGLHADELYYIALGKNLQPGYLDNGPFTPWIAALYPAGRDISAFVYRLLPTLFSAATVGLSGLAAFRLGGGRLAVAITCTALLCSPAYLATGYFLQPVAFEPFFWTAGAFFLLRYVQTAQPAQAVWASLAFALGILNKYSTLLYFLALLPGLLISFRRTQQGSPFWPAVLPGLLLLLPNLFWQIQHDFPFVRYLSVLKANTPETGAWNFLLEQVLAHGSGLAVWSAGLVALLFLPHFRPYRFLGSAMLAILVFFMYSGGKIYYMLGAMPLLLAAGGVCWEKLLGRLAAFWTYNLFALHLLVLAALPALVPILPLQAMLNYFNTTASYTANTALLEWPDGRKHQLPAFYADMLGWETLTMQADSAYRALDPATKSRLTVVTDGYAVTAALIHYKPASFPAVHACDNSVLEWSFPRLPDGPILFITDKSTAGVSALAPQAVLLCTFRQPTAIGNGTNTFLLPSPQPGFSAWYRAEREKFTGSGR
ncbi:hypothetical protein C7T94_04195 [Pedobacter yulinensis]|uniref:Glycosyltransferase RgtA/B/C/D-like domain-containing protein n=1 Tax=Pedobacter yulinensis TaxID=2126353 RepID=A0A2T3HNB7_9SPHI|nr:glycosyltransferase family 39 protein [Pedobacter yulinensis]PST83952.1 hypothetical protein C7T94_04195 [Pedobacter yulinensis]